MRERLTLRRGACRGAPYRSYRAVKYIFAPLAKAFAVAIYRFLIALPMHFGVQRAACGVRCIQVQHGIRRAACRARTSALRLTGRSEFCARVGLHDGWLYVKSGILSKIRTLGRSQLKIARLCGL